MQIRVYGAPAPQGSKRAFRSGGKPDGRIVVLESSAVKVRTWRADVKDAAEQALARAGKGALNAPVPVELAIMFLMPRPKSARNGAKPVKRPDLDKLIRSTLDALKSGGVYGDDSQVITLTAGKEYATDANSPGALIEVSEWGTGASRTA